MFIGNKIDTLNLVGVSTLVVVPRIRTSQYLHALAQAIPALAVSKPGRIAVEELPELRNVVLVDNTAGSDELDKLMDAIKCTVDFREIFVWDETAREQKIITEQRKSFSNEDIINLQFTR